MKIVKKPIGDLIPYEKNAKQHPQDQINQIKHSIQEFGFNDPIAIDENNVIIEGHGRLQALKELGETTVECIVLNHLTEAQKKAYIIAHNKLTMNTGFDIDILRVELEAIKAMDFDLTITGFELEELDEILNVDDIDNVEEDNYELELPKEATSQHGDIWQLGNHRLMCGSSVEEYDVEQLLNGNQIDLIVTDPPYNVNYESSHGMKIQNDHFENSDLFYEFLLQYFKHAATHTKLGAPIYVFHSDTERVNFQNAMKESNFELKQVLIWVKNALVMGRQDYHWRHEPILYGWKSGGAHKWYGGRQQDTVIDDKVKHSITTMKKQELVDLVKLLLQDDELPNTIIYEDKPLLNDIHPTMKPLKLLARLIVNSSKRNDVVYDGFGGSGSTLIASDQLGRTSYIMELDAKYVDAVVNRYYNYIKNKGEQPNITLTRKGKIYDVHDTTILGGHSNG
jgi:DNA modification methylase